MGMTIKTSKDTFIPRPETELLVKACLETMKDIPGEPYVLDIGTGSGNIPVALTKLHKECRIVALDNSNGAIGIARENARIQGVSGRIEFI
jgi:release factor glutamine methyltransferase